MILVDTSAWIDFLRGTPGAARDAVHDLLDTTPNDVVICEPVAMELLAGSTSEAHLAMLERLVNGLPSLAFEPIVDFRAAASIHRSTRAAGMTIRSMMDCLIAAVAIRCDVQVVHKDIDYEVIATTTPLRSVSLR